LMCACRGRYGGKGLTGDWWWWWWCLVESSVGCFGLELSCTYIHPIAVIHRALDVPDESVLGPCLVVG